MDLLFDLAVWHALAKLRLHTESTVRILEAVTTSLGKSRRLFASRSMEYNPRELPKEQAARGRRAAAAAAKGKGKGKASTIRSNVIKYLNLATFKWHDLGHVPRAIRLFGSTDGYSTQIVSVASP